MQSVLISVPEEHKTKVLVDLRSGSDPRPAFFLLVALSTLIAAFGLVMNSTAVVIGAMLVAPLMTPILGLALALVRGDAGLLGIALRSEIVGVVISITAGCILGLTLPQYFEPTSEMLSRTQPNLFDLLVAVLAGAAGASVPTMARSGPSCFSSPTSCRSCWWPPGSSTLRACRLISAPSGPGRSSDGLASPWRALSSFLYC
jgi:hypothetical protein